MYAAATLREFNALLDQASADAPARKSELRAAWRGAAGRFRQMQECAPCEEPAGTRPLSAEMLAVSERTQSTVAFRQTFANFSCAFEQVEIDSLVAIQRGISLDYTDGIALPSVGNDRDLADLCLNPVCALPRVRSARTPTGFALACAHPGLSLLSVSDADSSSVTCPGLTTGGQPVRVVMAVFGIPAATMSVIRIGKRLILSNGFHRAYRLRSAGHRWLPAAVLDCQHPDLELPETLADSSVRYLTSARRPPVLGDFFNADLVCEILVPPRTKSIQLGMNVSESDVPNL